MAFLGRIYRTDSYSGTIQEERTKDNKHKKPEELKHDFIADEVTFVNVNFEKLKEEDYVWFTLTKFQGEEMVDTIRVPELDS